MDEPADTYTDRPDRAAELRPVLIEAATSVRDLVGSPEVGKVWDQPSALEGMTVGGLAAHIDGALRIMGVLLEQEVPDTDRIASPFEFFGDNRRVGASALDDERARGIAERAEAAAAEGQAAVVDRLTATIAWVDDTLAALPPQATMATHRVPDARARLDDYLRTRLIEVVVHGDDLACSVGVVWHPPVAAVAEVIDLLVGMARERVGDLEVLRGLTREERAVPEALRAL